jgi:hypothetical protein
MIGPRVVHLQDRDPTRHCGATMPELATPPPFPRVFDVLAAPEPGRVQSYRTIQALPVCSGTYVIVYADERDVDDLDPHLAGEIVKTLEGTVLPVCDHWIGRPRDVDGDGRFAVLLSRELGGLGDDGGPVLGCVRPADFDQHLPDPFSNHCDMLYLDPRIGPGPHLRTVLAHEYAHATLAGRKGGDAEEPWLDEALAHVVEARLGLSDTNLAYRVRAFQEAPERSSLVLDEQEGQGPLRDPCRRGAGLSFLSWCAGRFGDQVITRVFESGLHGTAALEAATGTSFTCLMRDWSIAMARDGTARARERVVPDGPSHGWMASGTTIHAIVVGPTSGPVRVAVEGPAGLDMQVTALALP